MLVLSELLSEHYDGRNVIILIDEYDASINYSYIECSSSIESNQVMTLFRMINEATFKSNRYLEKGLITGVFRIAKANLFSGLNNIGEYGILEMDF